MLSCCNIVMPNCQDALIQFNSQTCRMGLAYSDAAVSITVIFVLHMLIHTFILHSFLFFYSHPPPPILGDLPHGLPLLLRGGDHPLPLRPHLLHLHRHRRRLHLRLAAHILRRLPGNIISMSQLSSTLIPFYISGNANFIERVLSWNSSSSSSSSSS